MDTIFRLPTPAAVANLFTILLGKKTVVKPAGDTKIDRNSPVATGVYINQGGAINALCVFDLALASHAGAALTMIPPGVAADQVKHGALADGVSDNLHEVFNVCVGFFNQGDVPHIRFSEMYLTPPALPEAVGSFADDQALLNLGMDVSIESYGSGQLCLYTL